MSIHHKREDKKRAELWDILFVYFTIFLLWAGYRIFFFFPEWVDEFIAKPILWIVPFVFLQKNELAKTIKSLRITTSYNIIFGLFIGICYFVGYTLLTTITRPLPSINPDHLKPSGIVLQFFIALSTGCIEELIFRKYILEKALSIFNDSISANSFTTLLFTLIHIPVIVFVYKYSLASTLSYLSIIGISGYIYGLVYMKKKSLIASTMTHALWNFLGTVIR